MQSRFTQYGLNYVEFKNNRFFLTLYYDKIKNDHPDGF